MKKLPIVSAIERMAERKGVKLLMLGKSGIGKTTRLKDLDPATTLFLDIEAGDLAVADWPGDTIVTCWSDAMVAHHESSKFPPVRGLPPTPDPLAPDAANPFADLEDDLPWEEPKGKKP